MTRMTLLGLAVLAGFGLADCKIVKSEPGTKSAAENAGEAGDQARITALVDQTYTAKLLPLIASTALSPADLRSALAAGLDAAGAAHGHRGAGAGAAWNFAVKGQGRVVAANLESKARKAMIDTDGDGTADLTLQLGPVIKGTALRDVAPFYDFGDFRDQIEFAKLARALNDRAVAGLVLPPGDLTGKAVAFVGVLDTKKPDDPWQVTAVSIEVKP